MWKSNSSHCSCASTPHASHIGITPAQPPVGGASQETGVVIIEEEKNGAQEKKKLLGLAATDPAAWSSVSSMSSIGAAELLPSLTDKVMIIETPEQWESPILYVERVISDQLEYLACPHNFARQVVMFTCRIQLALVVHV